MDKNIVAQAIAESLTREEVLTKMGLEHSMRNFRQLGNVIERNHIDTSHLIRMKAAKFVEQYRLTNPETVL